MNSGQEASPDRPAAKASEGAEATEPVDPENEALQRSQDAIDEGHEAAREALQDNPPDADSSEPGEAES
jgi:hypothetical protein